MGEWVVGPSNFIINRSPNPWILGFDILDLDFGLDGKLYQLNLNKIYIQTYI